MNKPATRPLWTPSEERLRDSVMARFMAAAGERSGRDLSRYADLHRWSVEERAAFWDLLWDYTGVVGEKGERVMIEADHMKHARFFPDARLNFAENLLPLRGDGAALIFKAEDKLERTMSWDDLRALVSRLQRLMAMRGIGEGDRVAAMMPNMPETVAIMLAATSLGAVYSSCSPDFGIGGVVDRFGQIEPKLLFTVDGYWYGGKTIPIAEKLGPIADRLPSLEAMIVVEMIGGAVDITRSVRKAELMSEALAGIEPAELTFKALPFDHPVYILFSSGTTGVPKCIVHRAGGVLLQHRKEHHLHCDIQRGDRVFWFTTCGWMMWNWLASTLACGATLLLYDGSPFSPNSGVLLDWAERTGATHFGTSPKYLEALMKEGVEPKRNYDLSALRILFSTGSPLSLQGFHWVYDHLVDGAQAASVSGGTDLCASLVCAVATLPVHAGEIQAPALGMGIDVWDEDGHSAPVGQKGELVCTEAFPSIPLGFWNDADDERFDDAYFNRFDHAWTHGDYAEWTPNGGIIIHGRSDATLNPGGVRIGTAEIYNQVETLDEVQEALCIGQPWRDDTRIVLFVRLTEGAALTDDLVGRIKSSVRTGASPRHVPAKVIAVADIPRTKTGKIVELAVRDVVAGRAIKNESALANPEALDHFRDLPELRAD